DDPSGKLKVGMVPSMHLGAFDIAQVPGEYGLVNFDEIDKTLGSSEAWSKIDIDGVIGASLLAPYRLTIGDEGRLLWMEDDTAVERVLNGGLSTPLPPPNGGGVLQEPAPGLLPEPPAGIGPVGPSILPSP